MIRFAPNFYHLFLELPLRDRFAAAAKIGCTAIEYHFPYELPKDELRSLLDGHGLEFTYCVVPADWAGGTRGLGAQPGRRDALCRDLCREPRLYCAGGGQPPLQVPVGARNRASHPRLDDADHGPGARDCGGRRFGECGPGV